jgi:replicative DNA helicase
MIEALVDELLCNLDSERTILGALITDSTRLMDVAAILTPEDLALDSHGRIFRAMVQMGAGNIDEVTLANQLSLNGDLAAIGGHSYLSGLTEGVFRRVQIDNHIAIVKDKALCRSLLTATTALSSRIRCQDAPGVEIAAWGVSALSRLVESRTDSATVHSAEDMLAAAVERINRTSDNGSIIPFGIRPLDEQTNGGMRLGELWVIGAAPSRGKTSLARQVVKNAVCQGTAAYVHSGEMTKESWYDITACLIEDMPAWKVRDPALMNLAERERLADGLIVLSKAPFYISDAGGISLERLIFNATRQKAEHDIKLFVVDYAGLIHAPGKTRTEQIGNVAGRLREFAKEHNAATILLSQLARPEGRDLNKKPNMFMLKESGDMEAHAQGIILNYMPVDGENNSFTGEDELIIGKQRNGPVGSVPVRFDGQYLKFEGRLLNDGTRDCRVLAEGTRRRGVSWA